MAWSPRSGSSRVLKSGIKLDAVLRKIRRKIRPNFAYLGDQFRSLKIFYGNCLWIIRIFYIVSLVFSYGFISSISHKSPESADFLWPVAWLSIGDLKQFFVFVPILFFLINCATVLRPELRLLRILFSLLCLFVVAIDNSFGGINHGWHIWFWISFILIFLPSHRAIPDRSHMLTTTNIIVYIQASILATYSMAGSLKLIAGIRSLIVGEIGNFSVLGFSSLLADRMVRGSGFTVLGDFFVNNPYLAFPLFVIVIFVQTASFPIVFFPRLLRIWGLTLIGFHFGTGLLMDIYFSTHVLWLALFLLWSPFRIDQGTWRGINRSWVE